MKSPSARRTASYHDFEASEGGVIIPPPSPYSRPPVLHVQTPSDSFQSAFTLGVPSSSQSGLTTYIQSTSSRTSSGSSTGSVTPSDSASLCSGSSRGRRNKARGSSRLSRAESASLIPNWTDARQHRFEQRLVRLTASAGLPLSWVENP